jgi:predicted RNA-binding Zn-ribbon protein involved in translation (DUF1610 family)
MVSDKVFDSISKKREFIQKRRGGLKWTRKRNNRYSKCSGCGESFSEGTLGATHFRCPKCAGSEEVINRPFLEQPIKVVRIGRTDLDRFARARKVQATKSKIMAKTGTPFHTSQYADTVFDYIVEHKTKSDGVSPTIREIADAVGISSTSMVNFTLNCLVQRGRISIDKTVSRGIRVVGGGWRFDGKNG